MTDRQRLGVSILVAAVILLGVLGTYAYFTFTVGTSTEEELTLRSGTMALTFADNDNGITASLNFGESVTKYFTIENTGTLDAVAKISFDELLNTYLNRSLTYKLEYATSDTGTYTEVTTGNVPQSTVASDATLANGLNIPAGAKYYYKLTITLEYLNDVDQTQDLRAIFTTKFTLGEGTIILSMIDSIVASANTGSPDFSQVATTDEGVYAMADDYGTSYYFRGAVENTYVYFAGFYWRIIRINGDGSVRMIYDGTQAYANGTSSTDRFALTSITWNTNDLDPKYVGYMYGGVNGEGSTSYEQATTNETDSEIKEAIDTWYKTNIVDTGYSQYVSDEIFCNDRSLISGQGYGQNSFDYYGARDRLYVNKTPIFTCPQQNDAFTVSDTTNGNGDLTYPVGLITADEASAAGGVYGSANENLSYYLYKGSWYWALSPRTFDSWETGGDMVLVANAIISAKVSNVTADGALGNIDVSGTGAVAPVINLSASYAKMLIGSGTMSDPYREV